MANLPLLIMRRELTGGPAAGRPPAGTSVRPCDPHADAARLARLVDAAAAGVLPLRAEGIHGALIGRPGRQVRAWQALPEGSDMVAGAEPIAGVVSLVVAAPGPRYSVGWLLVHPSFRRRGVATLLVETALAAARGAGAREVWVETHAGWAAAVAFWESRGFAPA